MLIKGGEGHDDPPISLTIGGDSPTALNTEGHDSPFALNVEGYSSPSLSTTSIENNDMELNPFDGLPFSTSYFELLDKRKALQVWKAKDDFFLAADESAVVLVTGRAGSGKSTQVISII